MIDEFSAALKQKYSKSRKPKQKGAKIINLKKEIGKIPSYHKEEQNTHNIIQKLIKDKQPKKSIKSAKEHLKKLIKKRKAAESYQKP